MVSRSSAAIEQWAQKLGALQARVHLAGIRISGALHLARGSGERAACILAVVQAAQ